MFDDVQDFYDCWNWITIQISVNKEIIQCMGATLVLVQPEMYKQSNKYKTLKYFQRQRNASIEGQSRRQVMEFRK